MRTRTAFLVVAALLAAFTFAAQPSAQAVPEPPANLSYSPPFADGVVGTAIEPMYPHYFGSVSFWSVSPALPAGLSINRSSGVISGTPTKVSAPASYTVTAEGFIFYSNDPPTTETSVYISVDPAQTTTVKPHIRNQSVKLKSGIFSGSGNSIGPNSIKAFIGGGYLNKITTGAHSGAIGGGYRNTVSAIYATVPGGTRSFATHIGSFVWSGDDSEDTSSFGDNTFTVRAEGGVRFYTANGTDTGPRVGVGGTDFIAVSDSNLKTKVTAVDPRAILAKLSQLPVTEWEYKHNPKRRYIGPMAQDFHATFGLGEDDKGIGTLDSDGVMYAAIQGLVEELKQRDKEIAELKTKSAEIDDQLRALRDQVQSSLPPAP